MITPAAQMSTFSPYLKHTGPYSQNASLFSCWIKHTHRYLPALCDDLRSDVCWRPTDRVQRSLHNRSQTKIPQLQRLCAVWIFTHLQTQSNYTCECATPARERKERCEMKYQQIFRFNISVDDVHSVQISQRSGQVEQHGAGVSLGVFRRRRDGIKQITTLKKHTTVSARSGRTLH